MDGVIQAKFGKKEQAKYCWQCWCGSQTFTLIPDGYIECDQCKLIQNLMHFDPREKGNAA